MTKETTVAKSNQSSPGSEAIKPRRQRSPDPDVETAKASLEAATKGMDVNDLKVEKLAIADLVLDPRNARKGDVKAIAASFKRFGQTQVIVVQASSMKVVVGNHRVRAAQQLGWQHVQCHVLDIDDKTATQLAIADNAVGDRASWDQAILATLTVDVQPDEIPGIDAAFLKKLREETTLRDVDMSKPPELAWFLIGIDIEKVGEIQGAIEKIAQSSSVKRLESTVTDDVDED